MTMPSIGTSEGIALLALFASVASLAISWRSARRDARITTYRSATDLTLDIDHQFIAHPELRPYFYDGRQPPADDDGGRERVDAMAELVLDCFECIWDIRSTYSKSDRQSWARYILDMLRTSPVMEDMFRERRPKEWYPALDHLHRMVAEGTHAGAETAVPEAATAAPSPDDPSEVGLLRLRDAPRELVVDLYERVLAVTFPPDELEPWESFEQSLRAGTGDGLVAHEAGRAVGGVVYEDYADGSVRLLSYLVVSPSRRDAGLGSRLLRAFVELSQHRLVLAEVEDPAHWPTTETDDPVARLRFWARHGFRQVEVPYLQPRLRADLERVRHLLLLGLPPERGPSSDDVPGAVIGTFVREYYDDAEGAPAPDDPELAALLAACDAERITLTRLPLAAAPG